ncbi:MAG: adenylate cyclase [Lachnospiraceae bacterium]|uniref:CYTH domain-containing protein n=1 Tax=Candidatus Weimeria bifida TaxID=2599074 RepID=A0A6N7IXS7_9FIRM|nr:CYTH domain-containing protein [Candidatus Weimeria bifida]RRF96245.1 MAG: adenylate cyclase [Lachnospiraceae bacterium]
MEIERKFLIDKGRLPENYKTYPSKSLKQGYVLHRPCLRIRKEQSGDSDPRYIMTYKDNGGLARQEINIEVPADAGEKLFTKCDGHIIEKTRYLIPAGVKDTSSGRDLTIELDVFEGEFLGLVYAEVEFDSKDSARSYTPPEWFGKDVTEIRGFSNSDLSLNGLPGITDKA